MYVLCDDCTSICFIKNYMNLDRELVKKNFNEPWIISLVFTNWSSLISFIDMINYHLMIYRVIISCFAIVSCDLCWIFTLIFFMTWFLCIVVLYASCDNMNTWNTYDMIFMQFLVFMKCLSHHLIILLDIPYVMIRIHEIFINLFWCIRIRSFDHVW